MDATIHATVHTWIGQPVYNPQGDKLGELQDLVFDIADGQILYGVLVVSGGVLGSGSRRLFAVPWPVLRIYADGDTRQLRLDASPERLRTADGFDKDNWRDQPDAGFIQYTHTMYS